MHSNSFSLLAEMEEETKEFVEEELPITCKNKKKKKKKRNKRRNQEANRPDEEEDMDPNAPKMELKNPDEEEDTDSNAPKMELKNLADEEHTDPIQFRENRLKMIESVKESGFDPYPHKFNVTMTVAEYIEMCQTLEAGEQRENDVVSLAGRIMEKKLNLSNQICYDLCGINGLRVQLVVDASNANMDVAEFTHLHSGVERGDIVGVTGFPGKCSRGELSLFPRYFVVLSSTLQLIPGEKAGPGADNANIKTNDLWRPGSTRNPESYVLKDQETRYRQRYLDLMLNKDVPQIFRTRAKVVSYIRRFLDNLNFLEVETPMMKTIAGGAAAKPVPREFYLKQLLVGGLERVFEIAKHFTNDSELSNNPEFATCEIYEAYADYYDLMDLMEKMLSGMVKELTGGYTIKYNAEGFDKDPIEIDFTPPFRRIDMIGALEKTAGFKIPIDLSSDITNKRLLDACRKFDVTCPPKTTSQLLNTLVEHFVGKTCVNPTFIIDHPEMMRPLAKLHRLKPDLTESFQLFINKDLVCQGYTDLNDPVVQRQLLSEILKDWQSSDHKASALGEAYCTALEYGLPPTAGWGLGIDHLTMLLTDSQDIKEVIMFPAMESRDDRGPQLRLPRSNNGLVDFVKRRGWICITSLLVNFIFFMFFIYKFLNQSNSPYPAPM